MRSPGSRWAVGLAASACLASSVVAATDAQALGTVLTAPFVCEQQVSVNQVAGTVDGAPQPLSYTISAPAAAVSPATATFSLATAAANLPRSPSLPLTGVTLTSVRVGLDVFTTTTNSPSAISGDPVPAVATITPTWTVPATPFSGGAWDVPLTDIDVPLPVGQPGDRQWLRLKSLTYLWTSTGPGAPATGMTYCRLVAPVPAAYDATQATGQTTVEKPLFGFLADASFPLSLQYQESYTNFLGTTSPGQTTAAATYGSFAARTTVTSTSSPTPPQSQCTAGPGPCSTQQEVSATVTPGSLVQAAAAASGNPSATAITLRDGGGATSVTVSTAPQPMTAPLNPVTVTDTRGGTAGWTLTAALSGPFTEIGGGQIAPSAATISGLGCAADSGSATRNPPGTGSYSLASAVTLCGVDPGVDDSAGQSGGGQYTVSGNVTLTVPPFQKAGDYSSTIVVTLT